MKALTIHSEELRGAGRLDSWYFLSPATRAVAALERAEKRGVRIELLGGRDGLATKVLHPQRIKRALAAPGEPALPYLRPYDVFKYMPTAADAVSVARTPRLSDYRLHTGQILQTRSGRNLGPAVLVDAHLAQFVMSDDMIRIEIAPGPMRFYVLAYLNSTVGRLMLRRDKTGSVIDHLSESQVASQRIPILPRPVIDEVTSRIEEAFKLREASRAKLLHLIQQYESMLPPVTRSAPLHTGWTSPASGFVSRLDAAFYAPDVSRVRSELRALGGSLVAEVAEVRKPGGRYKTNYVDPENGLPLLSGTQLLQTTVINPQFMPGSAFKNIDAYRLSSGMIAYPADGRAEEDLGSPVLITEDRDGWLASGHIGRVVPNDGIDGGWLYLALSTAHAQMQIKASSSGSVVDSTFPADLEAVVLPPDVGVDGAAARKCWEDLAHAKLNEQEACAILDNALLETS